MAALTVQDVSRSGLEAAFVACSGGGDYFQNDGRCILEINNASVGDITVTIATQKTVDGKAVADDAVVITAGERRHIGPFPPGIYNDVNGRVQLTYSGVTTLTAAIIRVP